MPREDMRGKKKLEVAMTPAAGVPKARVSKLFKPDEVDNNGHNTPPQMDGTANLHQPLSRVNPMDDPNKKRKNNDSDTGDITDKPYYSNEAQLRMINLTFDPLSLFIDNGIDPDEAHLLGLTRINSSREAMMWAQEMARESAFNKYVNGLTTVWPVSRVRRVAFLMARRSLPMVMGGGFVAAVNVAQEQTITKGEETAEEGSW